MMYNSIFKGAFLPFLILILGSCPQKSYAQSNGKLDSAKETFKRDYPTFATAVEEKIQALFTKDSMAGDFLLAVVDENGLVYSYAMNREIMAGKSSSVGDKSPIYIASHTKSLTGTMLKLLEEDGKIDLNSPIGNLLPELHFQDSIDTQQITISHLLNHTHGTFSTELTWKTAFLGYSGKNSELIDDLNTDFLHDPSHQFRYSNVGPILAAMAAEKATGNFWKEEMANRIFKPLGMTRTSAYVSDFNRDEILPSVTVSADNDVVESGFYKEDITMHASGGTISTIEDLSKWLQANITQDKRLFKNSASWKDLHESTTIQDRTYFTYKRFGYSLGWDLAKYQEDTVLTRFGGLAGISVHISFIPARKIGIIAYSTDNRAFTAPHLIANYAYNLLAARDSSEAIFTSEIETLKKHLESHTNEDLPAIENNPLKLNAADSNFTGLYKNDAGWPDILIEQKDSVYTFTWGVLTGTIYHAGESNDSFFATLGVLNRNFEIKGDSLVTGSLVYKKDVIDY